MGNSADSETSYMDNSSAGKIEIKEGLLKLYQVNSDDTHSFYTLAESLEEAKIHLAKYETARYHVEPVSHSIFVLPAGSVFLDSADYDAARSALGVLKQATAMVIEGGSKEDAELIVASFDEFTKAFDDLLHIRREQVMNKE